MKLLIWTKHTSSLRFRGREEYIGCEVEIDKEKALYLESDLYVYRCIHEETGIEIIVEADSGAIIGSSISQVQLDISALSEQQIRDQRVLALKNQKKAKIVSFKEFWDLYAQSNKSVASKASEEEDECDTCILRVFKEDLPKDNIKLDIYTRQTHTWPSVFTNRETMEKFIIWMEDKESPSFIFRDEIGFGGICVLKSSISYFVYKEKTQNTDTNTK